VADRVSGDAAFCSRLREIEGMLGHVRETLGNAAGVVARL
jgi:hypothetical protein